MTHVRPLHLAIFTLAWSLVASISHAQQTLVIRGGTLIDGNGGPPLPNATLVIEGDRIREIRTTDAAPSANARVIDARGKFLIPGFHEPHAHYKGWFLPLYLNYGVTSVYDIGNSEENWILAQREMMQKEKIIGPRLFACVLVLYGKAPAGRLLPNNTTFDTVDEARAAAKRAVDLKADCLKLQSGLTSEMMLSIAQVGKQSGLPLIGHLPARMDAFRAAEIGMNHLEHSGGIPEAISKDWSEVEQVRTELAKAMEGRAEDTFESTGIGFINTDPAKEDRLIKVLIEKNVYVEADWSSRMRNITRRRADWMMENIALVQKPEMAFIPRDARYRWLDYSAWESFSPDLKAKLARGLENWQKFMAKFSRAGGKVVVGGEAPTGMPGLNIHRNVHLLADAGLPPMKAIQAATKNVAELFRKKDLGTLEVGKYADLIILDADPLQDITNTQKIAEVIKGGKVVDRRFSADWRNPIASPEFNRDESGYNNPKPMILAIQPSIAAQGEMEKSVRISGNGFAIGCVVRVDGKVVKSSFKSEKLVEAILPKDLLQQVGTYAIQVENPEPLPPIEDWGLSNKTAFIVKF